MKGEQPRPPVCSAPCPDSPLPPQPPAGSSPPQPTPTSSHAMQPWASYSTALCLNLFLCKREGLEIASQSMVKSPCRPPQTTTTLFIDPTPTQKKKLKKKILNSISEGSTADKMDWCLPGHLAQRENRPVVSSSL